MTTSTFAEKTLKVSVTGREPVELQLEGREPLIMRVEIQALVRAGSYTDVEPPPSRR